jgi:predicted nucleotidyltransferase
MRIKSADNIAGRPATLVRGFFRNYDGDFHLASVQRFFGVGPATARKIVKSLVVAGFAEPGAAGRVGYWKTTNRGRQLALATAAKPISRAAAEKKLSEFLERVMAVCDDPRFLYKVTRVAVFGSYLGDSKDLGDIDLAVGLTHKETDLHKQRELNSQHCREAQARGRRFGTKLEMLYWPQTEVRRFLKARSWCLSFHYLEELSGLGCEYKVIYEDE